MNKIPIFLHIPKNAGTFILNKAHNIFTNHSINLNRNQSRLWALSLRILLIKYENQTILIALSYDPNYRNNKNITQIPYHPYSSSIKLEDFFLEILKGNLEIFSLFIESQGFKFIKTGMFDVISKIINKDPLYCTILRHPLERALSLFSYLKSNSSSHEATHNKITSANFEDYIKSCEVEDSWLIRSIIGIPNLKEIREDDFEKTCTTLDKLIIRDIKNTNELIDEVFTKCYSLNAELLNNSNNSAMRRNETKQKKINLLELSCESVDVFKNRAKYDYKLYNKYVLE